MNPISDVRNCDCMEMMKEFPDKFFDLAIVDPPYGIGASSMNMGIGKSKKSSKAKNRKWVSKNWDDLPPDISYFNEINRVSKNLIIWGGNYFNIGVSKHWIIWDKEIPNGLSFSDFEMAWTSFDKAERFFRYSAYLDKLSKIHPTQKPIALYQWLIKTYAKSGDKILDTHLGSQSSRIAAYKMGFDFWGSELDPDYFREGCERFEKAIDEPLLRQIQEVKPQTLF